MNRKTFGVVYAYGETIQIQCAEFKTRETALEFAKRLADSPSVLAVAVESPSGNLIFDYPR